MSTTNTTIIAARLNLSDMITKATDLIGDKARAALGAGQDDVTINPLVQAKKKAQRVLDSETATVTKLNAATNELEGAMGVTPLANPAPAPAAPAAPATQAPAPTAPAAPAAPATVTNWFAPTQPGQQPVTYGTDMWGQRVELGVNTLFERTDNLHTRLTVLEKNSSSFSAKWALIVGGAAFVVALLIFLLLFKDAAEAALIWSAVIAVLAGLGGGLFGASRTNKKS